MNLTNSPASQTPLRRFRSAFTLVELLVVIAIIGILVGMLLPAVQQVREAARRTSCANNLAQLGLAIHNYEYSYEHLPPGVINDTGPINNEEIGQHVSFFVLLLPYIEQFGIANRFDIEAGAYAAVNAPARAMVIPTYLCPSSASDRLNRSATAGLTDYAGCHHSVEAPIDVDNNGLLFLNSKITYGQIADGSSNTILVGEKFNDPLACLGWASGTRSSLRNTGQFLTYKDLMLAPTNPTADAIDWVGGFGSSHSGGALFCLADGSVRFLPTSISLTVFQNLGNRADGAMMGEF